MAGLSFARCTSLEVTKTKERKGYDMDNAKSQITDQHVSCSTQLRINFIHPFANNC